MKKLLLASLLIGGLVACGERSAPTPPPAQPGPAASAPAAAAPVPAAPSSAGSAADVGRIEQVSVTSKGVGMTPGAAVNEALKTAVMQVNGVAVDATSTNLGLVAQATAQIDVYSNQGQDSAKATAQLQGQAFADQVVTKSSGLVSSFKVLNVSAPEKQGGNYTVDIEAKIAKYRAPADASKIKLVVAPLRSKQGSFNIGGQTVSASQVLEPIHRQIVDALAQTGRFTVLDRQSENEIQNELDMISSGKTVNTDAAKLGQALSADLIWIGEINNLAYTRHVRKLQTSDRDLISYSGGWQLSHRMVNLATRQIQQAGTLQGTAPSIAPTTLGKGIDANRTLQDMQADIVQQALDAILLRSLQVAIIERTGDQVVLNQGRGVVKENARYRVYMVGKDERPCCEVTVTRVTPDRAYATLENLQVRLDNVPPGALQLRESLAASLARAADEVDATIAPAAPKAAPARSGKSATTTEAPAAKAKEKDDW